MKLTFIMFVLGLSTSAVNAALTRTPINQGVLVGGSIRLNCSSNATVIQWQSTKMSEIFNGALFKTNESNFQLDNASYFDIYANNVDVSYADTYTCLENASVTASANVVVFGGPPKCIANFTSPLAPLDIVSLMCQVEMYGTTTVNANLTQNGQTVSGQIGNSSTVAWTAQAFNLIRDVSCVVAFGFNSSCPAIQVKPGNISISVVKSVYTINSLTCSALGSPSLLYQWSTNTTEYVTQGSVLTVISSMAGPNTFTCTVSNAYGISSSSIQAVVTVPVTDLSLSSWYAVHYAGDVIKCSAISYPPATYVWFDVNNSSSVRVNGSDFTITSDMIGTNITVQCNATNIVNGMTYSISSKLVDFYVQSGTPPTTTMSSLMSSTTQRPTDNTAIIAGVVGGVGGALLIVLVVVLCVFCCRRRKADNNSATNTSKATTAVPPVYSEVNKPKKGKQSAVSNPSPDPLYAEADDRNGDVSGNTTTDTPATTQVYAEVKKPKKDKADKHASENNNKAAAVPPIYSEVNKPKKGNKHKTTNTKTAPLYSEVNKPKKGDKVAKSNSPGPIYADADERNGEHVELSEMTPSYADGHAGQYEDVTLATDSKTTGQANNGFVISDPDTTYGGYAAVTAGHMPLPKDRPRQSPAVLDENHYAPIDHTLNAM